MPTFTTYPGKLPKCLNPFNWRHYFLVAYWVFFRPTALKCYLYQADPELYRGASGKGIGAAFALPAYRNLIIVALGSTVLLLSILSASMMLLQSHPQAETISWGESAMWVAFWMASGMAFGLVQGVSYEVANGVARGVASGVAFGVAFGVLGGMTFGLDGGMASRMALWMAIGVANGVGFGVAYGVGFGVAIGVISGVISGVIDGVAIGVINGVFNGGALVVGSLRLPLYILQGGGFLRAPWRGLHPLWWDELAVLPFLQSEVAIAQAWRSGEEGGLRRLAQLTANPFQRWVVQRALIARLHDGAAPIHFLYSLFQIKELDAFAIDPLTENDWQEIPSVRQIYLSELANVCSIRLELGANWVSSLNQSLSIKVSSPLVDLAWMLHELDGGNAFSGLGRAFVIGLSGGATEDDLPDGIVAWWLQHFARCIASSDGATDDALPDDILPGGPLPKDVDPGLVDTPFQSLLAYPGGEELQRSFGCMAFCLEATSLAELANGEAWFQGLPAAREAIRPPVIEALGRFAHIRQDITVSEVASSRVNQLAALGRAIEGLEELRVFIAREVWSPEQVMLQMILQRWRSLVSGASGRLGQQVLSKRVANPYVAGNPVTGRLFVGRDDILRELEELWLSRGQVDSVVLFGHRRMGKSSILKNLPARLDSTYNRVVDFNLQQIGTVCSTGELLHALALEMRDHLPANGLKSPAVPNQETFEANPNRTFSDWLKTVAPLMVQHRFIVAIDEYELLEAAMAEGRIDASLTTYLRSVIQSTDWFVLVLAGLYSLEDKCHDYWHPLFASIKPRKVSFLSPAATRLLLCQPSEDFPLNYTADTIEEVVRLSNGQPYLVQLIGQNLVTRFNRQVFELGQDPERPISLDDLLAVIDSPDFFQDSSPYCKAIWKLAADAPLGQQVILKALAHESKDLQQLIAETGLSEDAAKEALSTLTAHDVVLHLPDTQRYGFTVELMRRWVLHTNILQQ